jgi:release factor glutamine methyltransferase
VLLLRYPGVYRPEGDTWLLTDVLRQGGYAAGRRVLDVGTGAGALALAAARAGAATITAVDLSLRSVIVTWLNSRLHRAPVIVRRGDLFAPVVGQQFDLIMANPPYVPSATDVLPRYRISRCWDAGPDGRAVLDRICTEGPALLAPDGMLLLVHSVVSDVESTVGRLADADLDAEILTRATVPFGPVMRARVAMLETRRLIETGQCDEELVVIGARRAH